MSLNTLGYFIVQEYLDASFKLDADRFSRLLSDDVEMQHTSNQQEFYAAGKDAVMNEYKKHFFDITSNIDIKKVNIESDGMQPKFVSYATQDKTEGNKVYRANYIHSSTLSLKEEKGMVKIIRISASVIKEIVE